MSLQGNIVTLNRHKLESLPYIGMELLPWINYKIRLIHFNLLRLKIRTNGSICRFMLMFLSRTRGLQEGSAVIVDQSKEWQTLEIPFANF
jgi:hypothetical protein